MSGVLEARAADEADRVFCWAVHRDTMRPYVEALWGWDERDQRARFDHAFDTHRPQCLRLDGVPAGLLRADETGTPVRLLNLHVAPAFQRRGLGTRVIAVVIERAGTRPVWLQVFKSNPARALYARLGFVPIGETPTHLQMLRTPTAPRGR